MILVLWMMGIFGILGLSVLCPLLALSGYYFRHRESTEKPFSKPKRSSGPLLIEIIVPAHNEEELIGGTLKSIQRSIQNLQSGSQALSPPNIRIHVGADGCTDNTAFVARGFEGVTVTESLEKRGKWVTLKTLISESHAYWVILVDTGTIWPENFLSDVVGRISDMEPNVMAIAPSYRPMNPGWLHRILWNFENALKHLEAYCGGPISLHGATVCYRTPLLKKAVASLGDTHWINDDVVIPLTLRVLYPKGVILYPVGEVLDAGVKQHRLDLGRRKRLLFGNLQWVRALLPSTLRSNPVAGLVAGRRLFRMLWAYWFVMIAFALAMAFQFIVLPGVATLGILMLTSGSFRQFSGAALVSLLTPFLMFQGNRNTTSQPQRAWK